MDDTALVVYADMPSDDEQNLLRARAAWLDATARRSSSAATMRVYRRYLDGFTAYLAHAGLRLDSDPTAVADAAQAWAGRPSQRDGGAVSTGTYRHRLDVISSFYAFACRRGHLSVNPIARISKPRSQEYAGARPLDFAEVQQRLAAIDRTTLMGARDYALLTLALFTGRRAAELAALTWDDIETQGDDRATITWRRTKGGKVERNIVPSAVVNALGAWAAIVADNHALLPAGAPAWRSFDPHGRLTARALSPRSLSLICERRLGTSKVHATRHTFSLAMLKSGATLPEIQAALGHVSLATTGKYVKMLHTEENPYAEKLAALYGLATKEDAR